MLKDVHCEKCGRFLCRMGFGKLEIKCTNSKCKFLNEIVITSYTQLLTTEDTKDIIES